MTPLEKVAKASYEASEFRSRDDMGSPFTWDDLADFQRKDRLDQTRATLLAVREIGKKSPGEFYISALVDAILKNQNRSLSDPR